LELGESFKLFIIITGIIKNDKILVPTTKTLIISVNFSDFRAFVDEVAGEVTCGDEQVNLTAGTKNQTGLSPSLS